MPGFGAPAFTTIPMRESARSTSLPLTTLPSFASASSEVRARITTSAGSPRDRRFGIEVGAAPIEAPLVVVTLWPVDRSHSATSVLYAAVNAPETIT